MIATVVAFALFGLCLMVGEQPWRQSVPRDWDPAAWRRWSAKGRDV